MVFKVTLLGKKIRSFNNIVLQKKMYTDQKYYNFSRKVKNLAKVWYLVKMCHVFVNEKGRK